MNSSKDGILKNQAISEILPNFAPIFRGEGVEIEKKCSLSIRKYISRAIQIWNQIFKIFGSCVGYRHLKNITAKGYKPIFGHFFHKSREREFSQIWGLRRKLANHNTLHFRSFLVKTTYLPTTGPFFGKMRIFPKNRALSLLSVYGPLT